MFLLLLWFDDTLSFSYLDPDNSVFCNLRLLIANMLTRLHLSSWRRLGHSIRSNTRQHWGIRQKPKTELFKQIKLTPNRPLVAATDESDEEKLVDEFGECVSDDRSCQTNASCSFSDARKLIRGKQLLQFDKSHRPAFYGIWPQKR